MPSQGALTSVLSIALKNLCSTVKHLYLFERVFLKVQVVCKNDFHAPFVCGYVTL